MPLRNRPAAGADRWVNSRNLPAATRAFAVLGPEHAGVLRREAEHSKGLNGCPNSGFPSRCADCAALTGEMDYLLRVVVADMAHYSHFIMDTLLKPPSVQDLQNELCAGPGQSHHGDAFVSPVGDGAVNFCNENY